MDPLSIIAGVAGIATAGVQLANVLFDTIDTYRNAPKEITSIARGIQDLSIVLDQLIGILEDGWEIHTRRLRKSISSAVRQIGNVHVEVWELIERGGSGFGRVKWAFRKTKMKDLMSKIEAQKGTIQLVSTTLLLAMQQTKIKKSNERERRRAEKQTRARLRRQAEGLVKAAHESLLDLSQASTLGDSEGPSTPRPKIEDGQKGGNPETRRIKDSPATYPVVRVSNEDGDLSEGDIQLQSRRDAEDTALWVYNIVFAQTAQTEDFKKQSKLQPNDHNALVLHNPHGSDVVLARRPMAAQVVDDLLYDWTRLGWRDIEETSEQVPSNPYQQQSQSSQSQPKDRHSTLDPDYHRSRSTRRHSGGSSDHSRSRSRAGDKSDRPKSLGLAESVIGGLVGNQLLRNRKDAMKREDQAEDGRRSAARDRSRPRETRPRAHSDVGPERDKDSFQATVEDGSDDSVTRKSRERRRKAYPDSHHYGRSTRSNDAKGNVSSDAQSSSGHDRYEPSPRRSNDGGSEDAAKNRKDAEEVFHKRGKVPERDEHESNAIQAAVAEAVVRILSKRWELNPDALLRTGIKNSP